MAITVFFSWQIDTDTRDGRNFIEKALRAAVANIAADATVEEAIRGLEVDKDTQGVPGTPPLFDTILKKIDNAAVFVADLTICGVRRDNRPTPNPNVLIEYGYALRALGHSRIVNVMNAAHGAPGKVAMPFDLAHMRHPLTYELAAGADDSWRKMQREQLEKKLESALRLVFKSDEYKAALPKSPGPPAFEPKTPMNGKARFRAPGEPLGFGEDVVAEFTGVDGTTPIYLADGPAAWFHISPQRDPGRTWRVHQLKQTALELSTVPISRISGSIGGLRGDDGFGYFPSIPGEAKSVVYVFETGEVWIVDAWMKDVPNLIELNEKAFAATLERCAVWLQRIECPGPYQWSVGMEDIKGRRLSIPTNFNRTFGTCLKDMVDHSGMYNIGDDAETVLGPFFEKVWDACGRQRPTMR